MGTIDEFQNSAAVWYGIFRLQEEFLFASRAALLCRLERNVNLGRVQSVAGTLEEHAID